MTEVSVASHSPRHARLRRIAGFAGRVAVTLAILGYLVGRTDLDQLVASAARVSILAFFGCFAGIAAAYASGCVRWHVLMRAYGATRVPGWGEAARLFLISAFYNLLPGAVGGDVFRAYATRGCFDGAVARSLSVVFVERVLGLAALLALTASVATTSPLAAGNVVLYTMLGLAAAAAAFLGLALGRRLAGHLPGQLGSLAASIPGIQSRSAFALAIALSLVTQVLIALAGHALVLELSPHVSLSDSFIVFSLGSLAAYFPATVAGAGARDTAIAVLFARVGVPAADSLTISLTILGCSLLVAGVGAVLQAVTPKPARARDPG